MAAVHGRLEEPGRPGRLGEVGEPAVGFVDRRLVGVEQVRVGELPERGSERRERVGLDLVVVVDEHDELAAGELERRVRGAGDAQRPLGAAHTHTRLELRMGGEQLADVGVRGGVVGHAQLPIGAGLAQHRGDRTVEEDRIGIVDREQDREARLRAGRRGDPLAACPAGTRALEARASRRRSRMRSGEARVEPDPATERLFAVAGFERQLQPQLAAGGGQLEADRTDVRLAGASECFDEPRPPAPLRLYLDHEAKRRVLDHPVGGLDVHARVKPRARLARDPVRGATARLHAEQRGFVAVALAEDPAQRSRFEHRRACPELGPQAGQRDRAEAAR